MVPGVQTRQTQQIKIFMTSASSASNLMQHSPIKNILISATACLLCYFWAQTPLNLIGFFFFLFHFQVEESLNEMDFQLLLELHFTDGDYT